MKLYRAGWPIIEHRYYTHTDTQTHTHTHTHTHTAQRDTQTHKSRVLLAWKTPSINNADTKRETRVCTETLAAKSRFLGNTARTKAAERRQREVFVR